jgi:hypothetical protein
MDLTKSDVARRQLVTAIRLFFNDGDPVSVYTLASNAWEIVDQLCKRRDIDTVSDHTRSHIDPSKDLKHDYINKPYRNFFKHADNDPDGVVAGFNTRTPESVLFLAAEDYIRLNRKSPVEVQVYQSWFTAMYPEKLSPASAEDRIPRTDIAFPSIAHAERRAQLTMGLQAIAAALSNAAVISHSQTELAL